MHFLLQWCVAEIKKLKAQLTGLSGTFFAQISNLQSQINAISGGGGGAVQVYQYENDPTAESISPADPTLPAICYQKDGNGDTYTWNTNSATWQ